MILEIFLALSWVMPSLRATLIRYSLPEGFGSPGSRVLSETPRLTSLSLNTSRTALARSSLLARMSTACSPDQAMDAPTPRKSNRVPISLAAWLTALSTSERSSLETMSKEDSCAATAPRLDATGAHRHAECAMTRGQPLNTLPLTVRSRLGLSFWMPPSAAAHGRLPEWPKGAVCKTVGSAYVGSNPTPATTCENGPLAAETRPAGRFLLVTSCISACHCGSMYGSVHVHMVYGVRAKLAVRITARFAGPRPFCPVTGPPTAAHSGRPVLRCPLAPGGGL